MENSLNPELFYDSQINNEKLTWGLLSGKREILRGVLDEGDYSFSVSHSYSNAQDELGIIPGFVETGNKASDWMRYGKNIWDSAPDLLQDITRSESVGNAARSVQTTVDTIVDRLGSFIFANAWDDILKFAKKAERGRFFSALDYIKVFQGTSINFTLPELKTLLLSGVYYDQPIRSVLSDLNKYFIGSTETYGGMFGLQDAPNQYLANFAKLEDLPQFPGSFKLRLGDRVVLKNLILTDYNVTVSKFKRKLPPGANTGKNQFKDDYLYAEVSVTLMAATYVTKNMINDYFGLASKSNN